MARRGLGGGMTALRAALGAVSGGLEGARQAEALRQKQKLDEENAAFNRAGMLKSLGFTPRAVRDTADPAAMNVVSLNTPTLAPRGASQAFASAMQQGMGVDPSQRRLGAMDTQSTATPLTAALGSAESKLKDFERQRSSLRANPDMQMNLPGAGRIGFDPEETEEQKAERALKTYEAQLGVQQKVKDLEAERGAERQRLVDEGKVKALVLAGVPDEQARAGVSMGAQFRDLLETPESRRKAEMDYRNLSLNERRYALEIAKYNASEQDRAVKAADALDKKKAASESLKNVLPTISKANQTLGLWTDKELNQLSPEGVNAAMVANMSSTTPEGIAKAWLLNKTLVSPLDREYAQYARATADAVARASEVGVLTNQDVARYQNQVAFVAGDDPETKRRKFDALKSWGSWLETQKNPLLEGNRRSLSQIPGETKTEALARLRGGQ